MLIIFLNSRLAPAVFFCTYLLFPRGTGRSPVSAKKLANVHITAFSWAIKLTVFACSVHALSALRGAHFPSSTREKIRMGGTTTPHSAHCSTPSLSKNLLFYLFFLVNITKIMAITPIIAIVIIPYLINGSTNV